MTFIYTYRDTSGAIGKAEIEAESRSAVFAQLKEKGITPLQVQEGKLPKAKSASTGNGKKANQGMVIGAAVAALVFIGAVIWFASYSGTDSKTPATKKPKVVKQQTGKLDAKGQSTATPIATTATNGTVAVKSVADEKVTPPTTPTTSSTNTTNKAETNKVIVVKQAPGTFNNSTEQLLSMIFTCELGNTPPPLPKITNVTKEKIEEILSSQNLVKETDSEKVADAKRTVELAKKELKDYLDKGGDINEFMAYYRGQLMQAHHLWQDEQKAMMKTCREEEPEVAKMMLEAANKRLAEKGIKPIMMPPIYKKKLGLE